jgi:hypothetical protein
MSKIFAPDPGRIRYGERHRRDNDRWPGFERRLMFVTGVAIIRDVVPFASTPGNAAF